MSVGGSSRADIGTPPGLPGGPGVPQMVWQAPHVSLQPQEKPPPSLPDWLTAEPSGSLHDERSPRTKLAVPTAVTETNEKVKSPYSSAHPTRVALQAFSDVEGPEREVAIPSHKARAEGVRRASSDENDISDKEREERGRAALASVKNFEQLQVMLQDPQVRFWINGSVSCSQYLFTRLLGMNVRMKYLAWCLLDPGLNPLGTGNIQAVLRYFEARCHQLDLQQFRQLEKALYVALKSGSPSQSDWRAVLLYLFDMIEFCYKTPSEQEQAKLSWLRLIWSRARSPSLRAKQQVNSKTLVQAFYNTLMLSTSSEASDLACGIFATTSEGYLHHPTTFSSRAEDAHLASMDTASLCSNQDLRQPIMRLLVEMVSQKQQDPDADQMKSQPLLDILNYLSALPPDTSRTLVLSTTSLLSESMFQGHHIESETIFLDSWRLVFHCFTAAHGQVTETDPRAFRDFLAQSRDEKICAQYLKDHSRLDIVDFFLRSWCRDELLQRDRGVGNIDEFLAQVKDQVADFVEFDSRTSPVGELITILSQKLPTGLKSLNNLFRLLFELGRPGDFTQFLKACTACRLFLATDTLGDYIHLVSQTNITHAVALYRALGSPALDQCGDFAVNVIKSPVGLGGPDCAWRLLETGPSWSTRAGRSVLDRRVAHVRCMAEAYAYTDHLSPSQAFKYTYRCSLYLRRRGEKIGSDLSRALVHAGTRVLQAYKRFPQPAVAATLKAVQEPEGEEVTSQLDQVFSQLRKFNDLVQGVPSQSMRWLQNDAEEEMERRSHVAKMKRL